MKGFSAGKGTGMSPNTMKKGTKDGRTGPLFTATKKKGSSMKKPLVGDQDKLPQELQSKIKAAPMEMGMNPMQGKAMAASNNMLPGSMMAMKANRWYERLC